jgi:hypothetical protein
MKSASARESRFSWKDPDEVLSFAVVSVVVVVVV